MASNISSNDDDLFDYDPDLEQKPTANSFSSDEANRSNFTSSENNLYNDIKNHLHDLIDTSDGILDGNKVKLATGFHEASYSYFNNINSEAMVKSVTVALDTLTEGGYSLLLMFHRLEMRISRRMHFLNLFEGLFVSSEISDNFIKSIFELLKVDINDLYIRSCYSSSIAICNHALRLDRATYRMLSEKLDIPVKECLFANPSDMKDDEDHKVGYSDFHDEVEKNINEMLFNSGLSKLVSEEFSTSVILRRDNEE
jgi:hypothetical protein